MALTASVNCSLPYGEGQELSDSNSPEWQPDILRSKTLSYSKEQLSSCTPLTLRLTRGLEEGTAQLVYAHDSPPLGRTLGQIFVSRRSNESF